MKDKTPLWYRAYNFEADLEDTLTDAEYVVARQKAGKALPELFIQEVTKTNRRKSDFYMYVGIASTFQQLPDEANKVFGLPPFFKARGKHDLRGNDSKINDIKEQWRKRTEGRILYRRPEAQREWSDARIWTPDDAPGKEEREDNIIHDAVKYKKLLLYLSAVGEGEWRQFCQICQAFFPNGEEGHAPPRLCRRLTLLGHLVVNDDRTRWSVSSPILLATALPDGTPDGFLLCGAQDEALLCALRENADANDEPFCELTQPYGDAPPAVLWSADPREALAPNLPGRVYVQRDPLAPANALPTISEWRTMLKPRSDLRAFEYDVRLFDGVDFKCVTFENASGFYELWSLPDAPGGRQERKEALYFDAVAGVWREGDWYGLRYLHHVERNGTCEIAYHAETGTVCVPEICRFPLIYERVLTLTSGLLPQIAFVSQNRQLVYSSVSRSVLDILAQKMSLEIIEVSTSPIEDP
jgi:hypothetical protein